MSEIKVVILIFTLILSPCVLGLLPDRPVRKKRHQPEPSEKADPLPERSFCDVQETKTDSEVSFCDVLEPESETVTDDVIDFHDYFYYEYTPTEKDRKAEFDRQQAAFDVDYLIGTLDILYSEYHSTKEDLDILAGKIDLAEAMHEVDKMKRLYKDREKLNKSLLSISGKIHSTEKKLRPTQFKAGMKTTC